MVSRRLPTYQPSRPSSYPSTVSRWKLASSLSSCLCQPNRTQFMFDAFFVLLALLHMPLMHDFGNRLLFFAKTNCPSIRMSLSPRVRLDVCVSLVFCLAFLARLSATSSNSCVTVVTSFHGPHSRHSSAWIALYISIRTRSLLAFMSGHYKSFVSFLFWFRRKLYWKSHKRKILLFRKTNQGSNSQTDWLAD